MLASPIGKAPEKLFVAGINLLSVPLIYRLVFAPEIVPKEPVAPTARVLPPVVIFPFDADERVNVFVIVVLVESEMPVAFALLFVRLLKVVVEEPPIL